jgi:hypothetical protein
LLLAFMSTVSLGIKTREHIFVLFKAIYVMPEVGHP